jgi:hypothetical protein
VEFLVYWDGYSQPTWEPVHHLVDCSELGRYLKTLSNPAACVALRQQQNTHTAPPDADDTLCQPPKPTIPQTYAEACATPYQPEWEEAMNDELASLAAHGAFSIVPRPRNARTIGSKWVYDIKRNQDGSIARYKARLVAKGFTQRPGLDFSDTYAPVCTISAVRLTLALTTTLDLDIRHFDIKTAFLNGQLDHTLYLKPPPGLPLPDATSVLKLHKSIYGLRQAGHCWNKTAHEALVDFGFTKSENDPCTYFLKRGDAFCILALFVDDILPAATKGSSIIQDLFAFLNTRFTVNDLGDATSFLGLAINRDRNNRSMTINQPRYTEDVLTRFGLDDGKPTSTPLPPGVVLSLASESDPPLSAPYAEAVGCLQYLAQSTRPDLAFAASYLGRFTSRPSPQCWAAARHALRYLRSTRSHGLMYSKSDDLNASLVAFSDADHATDPHDRRSHTGYVCLLGSNTISWKSSRQKSTAISTCESEYYALSETARETLWLRALLLELGFPQLQPTKIRGDNMASLKNVRDAGNNTKVKHIHTRVHFLRRHVRDQALAAVYVPSSENIADALTKPLAPSIFGRLVSSLVQPARLGGG